MKKYIIQDREAGNYIDEFPTLKEAEELVRSWEEEEQADGTYVENFYEIVEKECQDEEETLDSMDRF